MGEPGEENDTRVSEPSASKDQKAVAAEDSHGEFFVQRKAEFAWHSKNPLAERSTKFDSARGVEVVEYFIATIPQGPQGCFFGKKVKMIVEMAALQQPVFAEHRLHRNIQRDVKDFIASLDFQMA